MGDDQFEAPDEQGKEQPTHLDQTGVTPHDDTYDELERQARETMRGVGELGGRVRHVLSRASQLWAEATPAAELGGRDPSMTGPAEEMRARTLARRWATLDFLVDPELPQAMGVSAVIEGAVWRVDLVERGETRSLTDASEPYRGTKPEAPGPHPSRLGLLLPAVPEIDAGERRERLPNTALLVACQQCNGTGHRSCAECEGKGFVQCPKCHGRARIVCRRCRGRGVIADAAAERRARAGRSYWQVQAERMATDAAGRLADFAERLRQEHGVPLPPSAQWAPVAPASGVTAPCPACQDGSVPCDCRNGKLICDVCLGSGQAECPTCGASGRAIRHRELVRRFDTRIAERVVPPDDPAPAEWLGHHSLRRVTGETAWEGPEEVVTSQPAPEGIPAAIWAAAGELARAPDEAFPAPREPVQGERRTLSRRMRLLRVPVTRVEYSFAGQPFEFVAVGRPGAERFWSQTFPARWTRVGRFLRAVLQDLAAERPERSSPPSGEISTLAEYRERRMREQPHVVRILDEDANAPATPAATQPAAGDAD